MRGKKHEIKQEKKRRKKEKKKKEEGKRKKIRTRDSQNCHKAIPLTSVSQSVGQSVSHIQDKSSHIYDKSSHI